MPPAEPPPAATAPVPLEPALRHPDGSPVRVLVVDDEADLREVLTSVLRSAGYAVLPAATGAEAVEAAAAFAPDAVLLDVMLPDLDGWEVLARLRAADPDVCVLFLTARDALEDRLAGIRHGGDDYLTKPFHLEEVLVRLRGVLRRTVRAPADERAGLAVLSVGDLVLDEEAHEVRRGGDPVELSATEFRLLRLLLQNPRRVLSKAVILEQVWTHDVGARAHVVELYVSYLRRKVDAGRAPMIHTVRGVGYVLRPPA